MLSELNQPEVPEELRYDRDDFDGGWPARCYAEGGT